MQENSNQKFDDVLKTVGGIIAESVGSEISVYIVGSYARGDGIFDAAGFPAHDVDLVIVVHRNIPIDTKRVIEDLQNSSSLPRLLVDLHFYHLDSLIHVLPLWRFYDIKSNSRLIFGIDIRAKICNFRSADISKYDGLRMLAGELLKIMREGKVNEHKLFYVRQSAGNIKHGHYDMGVADHTSKLSLKDFVNYAIKYYEGGYRKAALVHLQPTITYVIRKKFRININAVFIISAMLQLIWTIQWAVVTKNINVLRDWRDPALRIFYGLIYYFNERMDDVEKSDLFKKYAFPRMTYGKENIIKIYDSYFLGDRWRSVRKSSWTSELQVTIE